MKNSMENHTKNRYLLFWLSQAVSGLGSSMTSFALIIWAYQQTQSAMTVSLLTFFTYLPHIVASAPAGAFVDRHRKKPILLIADLAAACCSAFVLAALARGSLAVGMIYLVNTITGLMNAFQAPAAAVVTGILVPQGQLGRVSGLNAFSSSLTTVVTPMLAASLTAWKGLGAVILVDLATFLLAWATLLLGIRIPEESPRHGRAPRGRLLEDCRAGFAFLQARRGLLYMMLSVAGMNFFSRLAFENILSPMILARSGGDSRVLGLVTGLMGLGGIVGGLAVSARGLRGGAVKWIYFPAALSFVAGDILMAVGRGAPLWCAAALGASLPLPFLGAGQNVILYKQIPPAMQGRVFALRNLLQYCTIPLGTLLGGALADYVLEPIMAQGGRLALLLQKIVGSGAGSGMAVLFLCTGTLGCLTSLLWYSRPAIRRLDD